MPTKTYKPNTPGLRQKQTVDYRDLTSKKPLKALTSNLSRSNGRTNTGRITVRHKGGGVKRLYRIVDFKRNDQVNGVVHSLEYDPNRSAFIALVHFTNGSKRYILAPHNIQIGDKIEVGEDAEINIGMTLPLSEISTGSQIHNIEITPGKGGQLVRSAGTYATLMAKLNKYASIKLPSGEVRLVLLNCRATYGRVSNVSHNNIVLGKAGSKRKLNVRPTVRGSVMNACDHKHGGGEGRAPIGLSGAYTAYGKPASGKTRNKKKSNRLILRKRK